MPQIEVLRKRVPETTIAGARKVAATGEGMRSHCMALNEQVCRFIQEAKLVSDGVSLALYYTDETPNEGIDVEMAYTVREPSTPPAPAGDASLHRLPAAEVAYAVYHGSYDDFAAVGALHAALRRWIEEQSLRVSGPVREYYLQPPRSSRNPVGVMEIQYPL